MCADRSLTRRSLLGAVGAGTAAGVSGCLSNPLAQDWGSGGLEEAEQSAHGYTPFFGLWDLTNRIGGDQFTFENPVETGTMGHGWSPDFDIVAEIAGTDAFVYFDTPEFAWAQEAAVSLEEDFRSFPVIDALEPVRAHLLPFDPEPMPAPDDGSFPLETIRFDEWDLYDLRDNTQLGYWHTDHWHGGLPDVPAGDFVPIGFVLYDDSERVVPLGDSYQFDARVVDGAADAVSIESTGDSVRLHGHSPGEARVVFEIYHDGEQVYDTAAEPLAVSVVEEQPAEDVDEFHDPHVWVDPVLMEQVVTYIGEELSAIDPAHAEVYTENAAGLAAELAALDETLQSLVETAPLDAVVFAGHDSFQYLEHRYGLDIETPTGISPDAAVTNDDIAGLLSFIEETGIDTVLYDPFEAPSADEVPQMVTTILENSSVDVDTARPLTPLEGTTPEWEANGWGYIEQMREINIPALERALNPD